MQALSFSDRQIEIINGSLLGDAHLTNPKYGNSMFVKNQCLRHKEYLEWTFNELVPFSKRHKDSDNSCKGKSYKRTCFSTVCDNLFSELRPKWYPEGIKVVPKDLKLTPLTIAVWFFDDGSNNLRKRCARFATYSFIKEDCEFLKLRLEDFGINSFVNSKNVIQVKTESYRDLVGILHPYMLWDCFSHKILYRDADFSVITKEQANVMKLLYDEGNTLEAISVKMSKSISAISSAIRKLKNSKLALNNTSGISGVSWDSGRQKWKAYVKLNGKNVSLGRFSTKEDAILAKERSKIH